MEKLPINPMQRVSKMLAAPRCLARTRRGTACQSPAVKGRKRCRMHGGTNPGAPKGNSNELKHGMNAANALEDRRRLRTLLREARSYMSRLRWIGNAQVRTPVINAHTE